MKVVKKDIRILKSLGIMFFLLFVLSGCGNNERSSPEVTLENYFSLVQDMDFEKSYEFIDPDTYLFEELKTKISEDPDEDVPEEIKNLKSYQEYTSEVAKLYKKIDYEIIDIVFEDFIGADSELLAVREYSVRVNVPNIDQIIEKSAMNSMVSLFDTLFTGDTDSEDYDDIYTSLVENIKNEDIEEEIIEGTISLNIVMKETSKAKDNEDLDESDIMWAIGSMDQNIFNALTPEW